MTQSVSLENPTKTFAICKQMELLCRRHNGLGLAAVQVGVDSKLFIVKDGNRFRYFVNCEYEKVGDDRQDGIEGCLSLPNQLYYVTRWAKIRVRGLELVMQDREIRFKEIDFVTDKIVYQHEIDHQNDVLISQIGIPVVCNPATNRRA